MRTTPARKRALLVLSDGPVDATAAAVHGLRPAVLRALADAGLAKYRPYGKPPSWAITRDGRQVVGSA